jgi:hypothetical protein
MRRLGSVVVTPGPSTCLPSRSHARLRTRERMRRTRMIPLMQSARVLALLPPAAIRFSGKDCGNVTCPSDDQGKPCSAHGSCNGSAGRCQCDVGYKGDACDLLWCPSTGSANGKPCSGHGRCNQESGECECASGAWGSACEHEECPTGANGQMCSGRGKCDGGCQCESGFGGIVCEQQFCPVGKNGLPCSGLGVCDGAMGRCIPLPCSLASCRNNRPIKTFETQIITEVTD